MGRWHERQKDPAYQKLVLEEQLRLAYEERDALAAQLAKCREALLWQKRDDGCFGPWCDRSWHSPACRTARAALAPEPQAGPAKAVLPGGMTHYRQLGADLVPLAADVSKHHDEGGLWVDRDEAVAANAPAIKAMVRPGNVAKKAGDGEVLHAGGCDTQRGYIIPRERKCTCGSEPAEKEGT